MNYKQLLELDNWTLMGLVEYAELSTDQYSAIILKNEYMFLAIEAHEDRLSYDGWLPNDDDGEFTIRIYSHEKNWIALFREEYNRRNFFSLTKFSNKSNNGKEHPKKLYIYSDIFKFKSNDGLLDLDDDDCSETKLFSGLCFNCGNYYAYTDACKSCRDDIPF